MAMIPFMYQQRERPIHMLKDWKWEVALLTVLSRRKGLQFMVVEVYTATNKI